MNSVTMRSQRAWCERVLGSGERTQAEVDFVDQVFHLCEQNYDRGGDIVVETLSPDDVLEMFSDLSQVKEHCGIVLEEALNCRLGSDDDPQLLAYRRYEGWED